MPPTERRSGYRRPGRPGNNDHSRTTASRRTPSRAAEAPSGRQGRTSRAEPDNRTVTIAVVEDCLGMTIGEARERYDRLTERQRQVAELMSRGMTNRQIADELGISPKTLDIHRADTFEKLEARTSAAVAVIVYLVALDEAAGTRGR